MSRPKLSMRMNKEQLFFKARHYRNCFERKVSEFDLLKYQVRNMRTRLMKIRKEIDYLLQHPWSESTGNRRWKK